MTFTSIERTKPSPRWLAMLLVAMAGFYGAILGWCVCTAIDKAIVAWWVG